MLKLTVFVFIVWTNVSHSEDTGFVLDALAVYCPFLSTCSRPAKQNFTSPTSEYAPCCQECSCDPLCHIEGNCCPDVSHNSTDIPRNLAQDPQTVSSGEQCIQSGYPELPDANGYTSTDMFKAIITCPEEYPSDDIADKCTADVPATVEQVLLVSDDKDTIYRNIYCAQCNGAQGVKRWTAMVRCTGTAPSFQVDLSYILKRKCTLISTPLSKTLKNSRLKRCVIPDISQCNVTGDWEIYNGTIERACHTVNALYFTLRLVYKNVFCFLCNGYSVSKNNICRESIYKVRASGYPFTAIIDPSVVGWNQDTKRCKRTEIYDQFSLTCRELICPPELSPVNGECVRALAQTNGFHVELHYMVKPDDQLTLTPNDAEQQTIMTMVYNILADKLRKRQCKLCMCWGNRVQMTVANYLHSVKIMTTPSCSLPILVSEIEDFIGENVSVEINSETKYFFIDHFYSVNGYIPELAPSSWIIFESDCVCVGTGIPFHALNSCPRVEVSGLDYMAALGNNYIQNTSLREQYDLSNLTEEELRNITFEICISEYFPPVSNTSLDTDTFSLDIYQISTVVFLSILCYAVTIAFRLVSPHQHANSCILAANVCLIVVQCLLLFVTIGIKEQLHCAMIKLTYQLFWLATVTMSHLYNILALIPLAKNNPKLYVIVAITLSSIVISVSLMTYSFRSIVEEPDCGGLLLYKADITINVIAFFVIIVIVSVEMSIFVIVREWRDNGKNFFFFHCLVTLTWTAGCLYDVYGVPYAGLLFFVFSTVLGIYMFSIFGPLKRILTIKTNI